MRVHVPPEELADVPRGDARYVPMPIEEFEEALARASRGPTPIDAPLSAEAALYRAAIGSEGMLVGTVEFEIGDHGAAPGGSALNGRDLPLGGLAVTRCTARTAKGVGEAVVFGRGDGGVAIATPVPGTYECEWTAPPAIRTADGGKFSLPLVPTARSTVLLTLPAGFRPLVAGLAVAPRRISTAGGDHWEIHTGPQPHLDFVVVPEDGAPTPLAVWTDMSIRGREAALLVAVEPTVPWHEEMVVIEKDATVVVGGVVVSARSSERSAIPAEWSEAGDRRSITVVLPPALVGTREPLFIDAVAPLPPAAGASLPVLRAAVERWAGGGLIVRVDPTLVLADVEFERCLAVTPEVAAAWPMPVRGGPSPGVGGDDGDDRMPGVVAARILIEQQAPQAEVRLSLVPRTATWDVTRVTTIDVAPGAMRATAVCDLRVQRGEAFDIEGRIAPGWFIDSVDIRESSDAELGAGAPGRSEPRSTETLEWRVARDPQGDVLRIGLTAAATPARSLTLRINGHRAGATAGASFAPDDIDMIRLEGEANGLAIIAFKTNPQTAIEVDGLHDLPTAIHPRLATLLDDGSVRTWAPAGVRAPNWQARLVRRRPPLDVRAQVRLTVRDDRLSESFTFECSPDSSDLDTVVVEFSEPMDDLLEWSLLAPSRSALSARRAETPRLPRDRDAGVAEAWLIEISPPVREPVTIRAVRTVSFQGPTPFPLAWVEGAVRQVGEVIVRDAGRRRPNIVNRRLAEIPAREDEPEQPSTLIGEFSYQPHAAAEGDAGAAAELAPGGDDAAEEARAWAWRETTSCWCHASGLTEFETLFAIESHGRLSLMLSVPPGTRLQGVLLDDTPVAFDDQEAATALSIDLPAGRRFVNLLVRATGGTAGDRVSWAVDPLVAVVDLPVLDRSCRLLLPPQLEIGLVPNSWRDVGVTTTDAFARLLGATLRPAALSRRVDGDSISQGFREHSFVPAFGRGGGGAFVVVKRRLLVGGAIATGVLVALLALAVSRGRPWLATAICVVAAIAALWTACPFDTIARAAWWGALAAALFGGWWSRRGEGMTATVAFVVALSAGGTAQGQAVDDVMRVFVTPAADGGSALVPESLFRALVRGEAPGTAVRILACRVTAGNDAGPQPGDQRWRVAVDVDSDAGGALRLDQTAAAARWVAGSARLDGAPVQVRLEDGDRVVSLFLANAGRHRIEIDVEPAATRAGEVRSFTIAIPVAPRATMEFVGRAAGDPTAEGAPLERCEWAPPGTGAPFVAGRRESADGERVVRYDVSRAGRVRLVRAGGWHVRPALAMPAAESRNDIFWDLDGCRLNAICTIDSGGEIVRSAIMKADPGLVLFEPAAPGAVITPLADDRFLIERTEAVRGPARFEISFRMPLADPVGVFRVPQAWCEGVAVDRRSSRLVASSELSAQVQVPADMAVISTDVGESSGGTHVWRSESRISSPLAEAVFPDVPQFGATLGSPAGNEPRARITVERRPQQVRGTQALRVRFSPDRIRLELQSRLDASSSALVSVPVEVPAGCVIDRIVLFEDGVLQSDSGDRGMLDVSWSRPRPDRIIAVVQRPSAGRFRLEVLAHLPGAPAAAGSVPVMRAQFAAVPLAVSWNESLESTELTRSGGIGADGVPLQYRFSSVKRSQSGDDAERPPADTDAARTGAVDSPRGGAASVSAADDAGPRVELTDVDLTCEERGRAWGVVRFDLVTRDPLLRLQLPPGLRLFEAFVDGHPVAQALPVAQGRENEWELRLHDVGWPRSLIAVFAGDLGSAFGDGALIEMPAPRLVGLPCARLLWTLRCPHGGVVRVAEPAVVVEQDVLERERIAATGSLVPEFERAITAADAAHAERMRQFLQARLSRAATPPEAPPALPGGAEASTRAESATATFIVMKPTDGRLTIRFVRQDDPTVPMRALATLAILAGGGAVWGVARRRAMDWSQHGSWLAPCIAGILGATWLLVLVPTWPAVLLLAYATISAALLWLRPGTPAHAILAPLVGDDLSRTVSLHALAPAADPSATQIAPPADPAAKARLPRAPE
jgi:hypothetical protein